MRLPEVDALKALAIPAVVLIHSIRPYWDPGMSALEIWIGGATRFAVPAFFFASGYLMAPERVTAATLGARLRRLLVPYALASLLAEAFLAARGQPVTAASLARDLALGSAFGIYYYVFVVVELTLGAALLARMSRRAVGVVLVIALLGQAPLEIGLWTPLSFFWQVRNPLFWGAYFVLGWWLRASREALVARVQARRAPVEVGLALLSLGLLAGIAFGPSEVDPLWRAASWLNVYVLLALIFAFATRWTRPPALVVRASEATYFIYLYHYFVVSLAADVATPSPGRFDAPVLLGTWLASLVLCALALAAARRALGHRTRLWLGA